MIEVERLSIQAGTFALTDVGFTIETGQYAVLMGPTGSGKTTIIEALCGLRTIRAGAIRILGRDVTRARPGARDLGYVPQDGALFPTVTVRGHLAFAPKIRHWPARAIRQRVDELAALLEIGHLLDRQPKGLSGGERQRVALGRALAFRPAVLLLDEPLSALDEKTRDRICQLLRAVRDHERVTVLHITHNPREADALADRRFRIVDGRVVEMPTTPNSADDSRPRDHSNGSDCPSEPTSAPSELGPPTAEPSAS